MTTPPTPPGDRPPHDLSGGLPYPSVPSGYGTQPPGGVSPYGAPQGLYGQPAGKGKTLAIVSVVTGALGVLSCCCFVLSIAAIVTGYLGKADMEQHGTTQDMTMAKVGIGLGIAGVVLGVGYWIFNVVFNLGYAFAGS